jgi:peroxiredoxin
MELEALQAALPDIQRAGGSLVAISPQLEKYGHALHGRLKLEFDILTDRGLQVASQFRLVFELPEYLNALYQQFGHKLDELHGENAFRLPMPARYVIDQQGVIRSADVTPDYTVRPDPSETVAVLERLAKGQG